MENKELLDGFDHQNNGLTASEMLDRLKKHGFYDVCETKYHSIHIKDESALNCQLIKNSDGSWTPVVSLELISVQVIISSVGFSIFCQIAGLTGAIPMAISAMLGYGLASLLLEDKKNTMIRRLNTAISTPM